MYTKNLYWRLLSLLLPRVVIGVAASTISSRCGSDLIVLWGGILIKIVIVIRVLRRRYLLLGLLIALYIVGLLLALHSAGLIGLLVGPLLGLIPPHPGLIDLISSGVIALLIVIIVVLLLVLIVVLLLVLLLVLIVVLIIALRLWLRIIIRLRMCVWLWLWLWLWLRLCVRVWHEQLRHIYTQRPAHSLEQTLIVGVHPPTLGTQLPHDGLQTLGPRLQTLLPTPRQL